MPFDAQLILKGLYSGALVDTDENDAVATSLTANSDGNAVVEVKKSGAKGLTAVVVLTEEADSASYSDETTIEIQESDNLDRNWQTVCEFPVLRSHLILLEDCVATTAFVAADVTTPRVLTATTDTATGKIVAVDQALFTIGGVGNILVEMQDSADLYGTPGDTLTATSGTGVATQGSKAGKKYSWIQHQPGIHAQRFTTNKRYLRSKVTAADNIGKVWIFVVDGPFDTREVKT